MMIPIVLVSFGFEMVGIGFSVIDVVDQVAQFLCLVFHQAFVDLLQKL